MKQVQIYVPPRVFVTNRVLKAMVADTKRHGTPETGEPMVGLVIPTPNQPWTEPDIVVLGTLPAGPDALRQASMVQLGGNYQGQFLNWYHLNWELVRRTSRQNPRFESYQWWDNIPPYLVPKWFDLPLVYLGDWHKHPGGMDRPSGGDFNTARSILQDQTNNTPYLLQPIVTTGVGQLLSGSFTSGSNAHQVRYTETFRGLTVSFYFLSRRMLQLGFTQHIAVPVWVVPDSKLPQLPAAPWHLRYPQQLQREITTLQAYGCEVRAFLRDIDKKPPLEICLVIRRPGLWQGQVLVTTWPDYPKTAPQWQVLPISDRAIGNTQPTAPNPPAPTQGKGWFERLRDALILIGSSTTTEWRWNPQADSLFTLIRHIELKEAGLWPPQTSGTGSGDASAK